MLSGNDSVRPRITPGIRAEVLSRSEEMP